MLVHTAQLLIHCVGYCPGIVLFMAKYMHVSHMLCCNIFSKSIYCTSLTTLPAFIPHCHLFCGYHPQSTLLSTYGGLPGKWFLLSLPNLEFQLQIYPSKSAKERQSPCQTRSSFAVGHIFNPVTVAEKGSFPTRKGLCPALQEESAVMPSPGRADHQRI